MIKLKQVNPENVWYEFEDEVDFNQYKDKMVIAGNIDFKSIGDDDLIKVVKGDYYDEDETLVENPDGSCYEDTIGYDYETAEELAKLSGKKNWVEGDFRGYSQGDWQTIWYVKDEVTQDEIKYMEDFYMGKMSEFHDEDMCCYYVPDDVVWKGKKEICDYLGLDPNDTEIYDEKDEIIE
jgi:hypothetical protein